ncbi:MAG: hypothetical protein M8858_08165 [marine benthic group bacterium]|nr:hypothetical protein [Gemmatimonadota bacterium]
MGASVRPEDVLERVRQKLEGGQEDPQQVLARVQERLAGGHPDITVGGDEPGAIFPLDMGVGGDEPIEEPPPQPYNPYAIPGPAKPLEEASDIRKSAVMGIANIQQALGEELRAAARAIAEGSTGGELAHIRFGYGEYEPHGETAASRAMESAGEMLTSSANSTIARIHFQEPENILQWAAQALPQGLISTIPPVVGSAAGLAIGGPFGALAGAIMPGYLLNKNEVRQALRDPGSGYEGLAVEDAEDIAAIVALPMAALDAIMPGRIVGKWMGPVRQQVQKTILRRVLVAAGEGAVLEGIPEALQNVTKQIAVRVETGRPLDPQEIIEDFAAGAVLGSMFGVGAQVSTEARRPAPTSRTLTDEEVAERRSPYWDPTTGQVEPMLEPAYLRRGVPTPPVMTEEQRRQLYRPPMAVQDATLVEREVDKTNLDEPAYLRRRGGDPRPLLTDQPVSIELGGPDPGGAIAGTDPTAPSGPGGPRVTRGVRGERDRELIETARPEDRLGDVAETPLSQTSFSLEARSDIVPSVNAADRETQRVLVREMAEAHKMGQPDDPVLNSLGVDPELVTIGESAGAWEGASPNLSITFDPSVPYETVREAMLSWSVRLGQRGGFMMQRVEADHPDATPTQAVQLSEQEYYRVNDIIAANKEKYPSIQGSSLRESGTGKKYGIWVDFSGNQEYAFQQLEDAFEEAGIDADADLIHTRSEDPNASSFRQRTARGFEEGIGPDLRVLRETSLPVWEEIARGQGTETSNDVQAAVEGYAAAVRHGTGVVPYSNTVKADSFGIFSDLGKVPLFGKWRAAMEELGYDRGQLTRSKYNQHRNGWRTMMKKLRKGEHMRSVSEIVQLARRGAAGKDWYYGFTDAMRPYLGEDAEVFTRLWAVTSQQAKFLEADGRPGKQLRDALIAYLEWKNGLEFSNTFLRPNLNRAINGIGIGLAGKPSDDPIGGRKIGNFVANALGDPDAFTADLWIQRLFGFHTDEAPSLPQYDFMEHTARRAAFELGWSTRQVQAALWEYGRKESGIPGAPIVAANGTVEMIKRVDLEAALQGQTWESVRSIVNEAIAEPVPAWPVRQDVTEDVGSGAFAGGRPWYAKPEQINAEVEMFAGETPRYSPGTEATTLHPRRFNRQKAAGEAAYARRGPDPAGAITGASVVGPPGTTGPRDTRGLKGPKGQPPKPASPPRPGPPKAESRPAARRRLTAALNAIEDLAIQTEATKRAPLAEEFEAELGKVLRKVLLPAQVRGVLEGVPKATTQLQAQRILDKAYTQVEKELHRRAVDELSSKYKAAIQSKMRPEFLEQVNLAVGDIDFETMSEKTRRSLEATARFLEGQPDAPIPEYVLANMRRMDKTSLNKLSYDELHSIIDAVDLAVHLNRTKNHLLGKHRKRTRMEVAAKVIGDAMRLPLLRRSKSRGLESRPTRGLVGMLLKEAGTRPEVLAENISEGLRQLMWEDISVQGFYEQERLNWQFRDGLRARLKSLGHPMGTRAFERWRNEPLTLRTPQGTVQISRDEAIWLFTSLKDPSNRRMFLKNGATLERSDRSFKMDTNTIADLDRILGEPEKAVSKWMHDQFNGDLKNELNKAWVETYGFEVARVEDYAPRSIDLTRQTTGADPLEQMAADREATLRGWGHLKERVGAGGPIRIGGAMDTYLNHAEHVARLSAYLVPVSNLNAIMGRVDVKQALLQRIGREGYNRLLNSVQMQTVRMPETTDSGRIMRTRMRMFGGSVLGIRLTTWFLNPSGIPISASYQEGGFKNMARSLTTGVKASEWKRIRALAREYSPYWRSRYDNFVHETTSGMVADRTRSYGPRDITELGLEPLQKSDQFGAIIRWRMAELFVEQQHPKVAKGSDKYNNLVAREWERMMFRGENTGHGGDMTGALALGRRNAYFAPLVMFTSSVSKIYSAGVRARLQLQRGDTKGATASFIGMTMALLWAAGVREGFRKMRGSDDDEPFFIAIPKRAVKDLVGFVPVIGPNVMAPLVGKAMGGSSFSFPSSITESVMQDMKNTGVAMISTLEDLMSGELEANGEAAYKKQLGRSIEGALQLGAMWFGVPWGWQDVPRLIDRLTPDAPDLRAELRAIEGNTTVTQENRRLYASIQTANDREFRRAIQELDAKGRKPTHSQVLAVINRKFGHLTKYEDGKDARDRLTPEQLELVDAGIAERDELRERADSMATANADILTPTQRRR